jgi:hypothetical protein
MDSYLNGIKDELDTVKSNEEFYERLDALVLKLSRLCPNGGAIKDQKSADVMTSLIFLIREGYNKGYNIVVRCEMKPTGKGDVMNAYMSYMQSDIGRVYSFYTTKDKAQRAVGDDKWAEMPVQFVMNNLFNRKEAVAFTFNGEYGKRNETIIVPLMLLWPVFQGKMPKPENFRESKK